MKIKAYTRMFGAAVPSWDSGSRTEEGTPCPRTSGPWVESCNRKQDKESYRSVYTMRVREKLPDLTDRHRYHCKGIREHTGGTLPYLATESQVSGTARSQWIHRRSYPKVCVRDI